MPIHNPHARSQRVLRVVLAGAGAVLMVLPFVLMLSTSFKPETFILETPPQLVPDDATLANYRAAWSESSFARYFANSLYVALCTTVVVLLLASMTAYAFARFEFPGKRVAFAVMLAGLMIPGIITIVPAFILAKNLNLLDSLNGLTLFYAGSAVAFITFLLRGFFERIPLALDEAMTIDGAGPVRRFVHLYLPMSRPALATAAIFTFLGAWDEFVWALTVINDPAKRTLPIAIAALQGQRGTEWGLVFAASAIAVIPVIVVYVIAQRQFIAGVAAGAVKD